MNTFRIFWGIKKKKRGHTLHIYNKITKKEEALTFLYLRMNVYAFGYEMSKFRFRLLLYICSIISFYYILLRKGKKARGRNKIRTNTQNEWRLEKLYVMNGKRRNISFKNWVAYKRKKYLRMNSSSGEKRHSFVCFCKFPFFSIIYLIHWSS